MLTVDYVLAYVKNFDDYDDTDIFDSKLKMLISSNIGRLEAEGIPNIFDADTPAGDMYCQCIAQRIRIDTNDNADMKMLRSLLQSDEITLRCYAMLQQEYDTVTSR